MTGHGVWHLKGEGAAWGTGRGLAGAQLSSQGRCDGDAPLTGTGLAPMGGHHQLLGTKHFEALSDSWKLLYEEK